MRKSIPRVVEIIGLAGAGKTTLCETLRRDGQHFQLSNFPDVHRIAHAPFFVLNCARLAPLLLLPGVRRDRHLRKREFAWLSILYGWPSILKEELAATSKTIILDQGPIYLLAELSESGPQFLNGNRYGNLWRSINIRWAHTLDLIVWLDAQDEILAERIRGREQEHIVKLASDNQICDFLRRFREAYRRIVATLSDSSGGPRVVRLDSGHADTSQLAARLYEEFGVRAQAEFS